MAPSLLIKTVGLLALASSPAAAFFRLPCIAPVAVERADPIVNPGTASAHLHTIMGGNGFGFDMTYEQTQAAQCSSCTVQGDNSNYWVPNLWYHAQDGSFTSVPQQGGATIYYLQRPGDGEKLTAFPPGLVILAGDQLKRSYSNDRAAQAISYACLNHDGPPTPETHAFPTTNCPNGLRAQIHIPSCWDGKNLDSPDHKSHMAYPTGSVDTGPCPSTHPVHFITLFYEVTFLTGQFDKLWYGDKQPFVWSNGDPTGYGFHGDFVNGWKEGLLQQAIDQCTSDTGRVEDCPVFTLTPGNVAEGCRIPPSIDEQISGVMDALPGCNAVQSGPENAASDPNGCSVSGTIGKPQAYFTDLTQTKQWSYTGCGTDSYSPRKFTGASTSDDSMTVEKCVDFCSGKGFSVAGTEYGRECYCANSIPADGAPAPGYMGNCMMPCAGDPKEYCGGGGTISLYQKCTATCQNVQYGVVGNITSLASSLKASEESDAIIVAPLVGASTSSPVDHEPINAPDGAIPIPTNATSAGVSPTISGSAVPEQTTFPVPASVPKSNVTLPSGWKAAGCYLDPLRPRLLPFWASLSGKQLSSSKCAAYCDEQGFSFAGTENGGQCFCSKSLPEDGELKDEGECKSPCEGDAGEVCGGPARLSVFTKLDGSDKRTRRHLHKHRRSHDNPLF